MTAFFIFVSLLLMFVSGFNCCEYVNTNKQDRKVTSLILIIVDVVLSIFIIVSAFGHQ